MISKHNIYKNESISLIMNPLINVRIPIALQQETEKYLKLDGYTNMQELIKTLLREYKEQKKKEENLQKLISLYGSQKGKKASKEELSKLTDDFFK
jgi:Arc/MetJ-type ribon-helix-helix transcriptional regulator